MVLPPKRPHARGTSAGKQQAGCASRRTHRARESSIPMLQPGKPRPTNLMHGALETSTVEYASPARRCRRLHRQVAIPGVPSAKLASIIVAPGPQFARVRDRSGVPDLLAVHIHLDRSSAIRGGFNTELAITIPAPGPQLARVRDSGGVMKFSRPPSSCHQLLHAQRHAAVQCHQCPTRRRR